MPKRSEEISKTILDTRTKKSASALVKQKSEVQRTSSNASALLGPRLYEQRCEQARLAGGQEIAPGVFSFGVVQVSRDASASFGTATAIGPAPDPEVVARYARESNEGLARALEAISRPGVVLDTPPGVPLFHVSPDDPNLIVRDIDGIRETGTFKDGKFEKSL